MNRRTTSSLLLGALATCALTAAPALADDGQPHALVIGINDYQHMPKLKTAVTDAKDVSAVLRDLYGYEVTTLLDATRPQIMSALITLKTTLRPEDSLII
jgi:hypothetical protein